MLQLYKDIIEHEYNVSEDMLEHLQKKILRFLRLFIEEALFTFNNQELLKIVFESSKDLASTHEEFELQLLFWETHFFSSEFKHHAYAEELFQLNPRLPRYLNFEHLLAKADKYGVESIYRRLLEITLQFDLDSHQKKLALSYLLLYQCEY